MLGSDRLIIVPVIAGLGIGIALIIVLSVIFEPTHNIRIIGNGNGTITFQPQVITVLSGVNNTVRWINQSDSPAIIVADNEADPAFYNATKDRVLILPHKSFEFTFTNLGKIGYHGRPEERGSVIVLHALPVR